MDVILDLILANGATYYVLNEYNLTYNDNILRIIIGEEIVIYAFTYYNNDYLHLHTFINCTFNMVSDAIKMIKIMPCINDDTTRKVKVDEILMNLREKNQTFELRFVD